LGIGLALVKGLVEMHGGTVTAESEGPGRGSTFMVTLPYAAEEYAARLSQPDDVGWTGPSRRVLVVDDNIDSADFMADMLTLLGHEVRGAHDGLQAIEAADKF
jgi:PleD family two-component response regulator